MSKSGEGDNGVESNSQFSSFPINISPVPHSNTTKVNLNKFSCKPKQSLNIVHQNVRFALNKKEQLEVILSELQPDILCLSEFALWKDEAGHYCLPRFQLISFYCRELADRGGGVATFVSDKYASMCKPIDVDRFCQDKIFETSVIQLNIHNKKYIIVSLDRSP